MKLYHNAQSWQLPGQQDKKAARIDVPTGAAELCDWLNERRVPVAPSNLVTVTQLTDEPESFDGRRISSPQLAGGAVLTEAEAAKVNATRPTFLPRLSAEEIEARRMAEGKCPRCGDALHDHETAKVERWMQTASLDRIQWIIEQAREIVRERGAVLDGEGKVN